MRADAAGRHLNAALLLLEAELSSPATEATLHLARELLRNNEPGLALEHVCGALAEAELPVPAEVYRELEQAGEVMQMAAETWTRLRLRV